MTSDVRYASGEVPQVGDVVEVVETCQFGDTKFHTAGEVCVVSKVRSSTDVYVNDRFSISWMNRRFKLIRRKPDMTDLDTAGVFHVEADKPAPYVPVWGPEWEYVANDGTVFTFLLDDKSDVAPIKLACEFGDVWFSRDGAAAFGASWAIVSQRPRTTAPVETKSSPKDRSPCCGASVSHVLMCDHCASEFLPETPAPSQPADVPQESAELTALRERLAGAEERIAAVREIVEQVKLSALKQADYEYAATMLNLRDCLDHGNSIDLDRLKTLLPTASRFVSSRAKEKQVDELHERVKFFHDELDEMSSQLAVVTAERDEAREEAKRYCDQYSEAQRQRSMAAKSLEYAELEISRLQNERNDLGDCEIQLRAELARAKADGERMRVALVHLGSFFGCSAHLPWFSDDACDEVSAMIDEKGGEKRYDPAFYETYCAQVVTEIVTGAIDDSSGGGYIAELRRQKLEAHMRGDIRTADRLAALLGDPLPSEHEKADSALAALAEDRR